MVLVLPSLAGFGRPRPQRLKHSPHGFSDLLACRGPDGRKAGLHLLPAVGRELNALARRKHRDRLAKSRLARSRRSGLIIGLKHECRGRQALDERLQAQQ
jgi:hypothetical protein